MKVVVNADDFGSTERHTRCILDLLDAGKISSATFLVNLPYSQQAADLLDAQYPHLRGKLGLHFNLIEGDPLHAALRKSPFVDQDGKLKDFRGRVPWWQQLRYLGKLRRELDLQIERFQALVGTHPTHIDSHGHTHCTWVVLLALLSSRQAGKVRAIRLSRQYDHEPSQLIGAKNKVKRLGKKLLNAAFRLRFHTVQYFTDIRNMDGTWLRLEDLEFMKQRFQSMEIMCHPYYFDESEYTFLLSSPNPFERMPGMELVSYAEV